MNFQCKACKKRKTEKRNTTQQLDEEIYGRCLIFLLFSSISSLETAIAKSVTCLMIRLFFYWVTKWGRWRGCDVLIRSVGIFGSFELHFESLHSNLKSIHGLNGSLSTCRIVETDKTCTEKNAHSGWVYTRKENTAHWIKISMAWKNYQSICFDWLPYQWRLWSWWRCRKEETFASTQHHRTLGASGRWTDCNLPVRKWNSLYVSINHARNEHADI